MHWDFGKSASTHEFRFGFLLACLIAAVLVPPYFIESSFFNLIWKAGFSFVLLAAMYSVTGPKIHLIPTLLLLVPTVFSNWAEYFTRNNAVVFYLNNLTTIGFLAIICFHFLRYILSVRRVTTNVIYASMCVYLMLGFIWAAIYANLNVFYDDAFHIQSQVALDAESYKIMGFFTYFSLVTLSTLGYGDVVPANGVAQAWAAVESMVGQFYMAIVIARLVGLHIVHSDREHADRHHD